MPYIKKEDRIKFEKMFEELPEMETKGELEYCIFRLMKRYMKNKTPNYSNLHDTTYAASHCSDEFRRRFLDARENYAKKTNGDV